MHYFLDYYNIFAITCSKTCLLCSRWVEQHDRKNYKKYEDKGEEIIMKKRSFTLLMSALTISATLIGTSPVAAKTDTDTATEETTDKEETTAKDADSENTDNKETDAIQG